jgi:Spy/CpxP family protein refolding chaperone
MKRLLTLTLILTLATAMVVAAQPPRQGFPGCDSPQFGQQGKHQGMRMGGHHGKAGIRGILAMGDKINLTDQQRDKLEKMMTKFQLQHVDEKAALQKARINLQTLKRDEAGQSAINAAIDKVAALRADMQKAKYAHQQEVQSVLTDEQKDQLKKMRQEFRGRRMGKPGCDGQGPGRFPAPDDDDDDNG